MADSIKISLTQIKKGVLPTIGQSTTNPQSIAKQGLKSVNEGLSISHYARIPSCGTKLRCDSEKRK